MNCSYEYVKFIESDKIHFPCIFEVIRLSDGTRLGTINKLELSDEFTFFPARISVCNYDVMMEIFYFCAYLKSQLYLVNPNLY